MVFCRFSTSNEVKRHEGALAAQHVGLHSQLIPDDLAITVWALLLENVTQCFTRTRYTLVC